MKLYYVRHGHSEHNEAFDKTQDIMTYRSFSLKHSHLTEKGVQQIRDIVLPCKMDRVYSSPLIRCIETSKLLVDKKSFLYLHDGLMETQGPFPCNWRQDYEYFHKSLDRYILKDVNVTYEPFGKYYIPNISETDSELKERSTRTVEQIVDECKGLENILVVTHNDWLESMFGRPFKNGEVYVVEYLKDK